MTDGIGFDDAWVYGNPVGALPSPPEYRRLSFGSNVEAVLLPLATDHPLPVGAIVGRVNVGAPRLPFTGT